ncbi:hypothetical protein LSH36_352g00009 [Paralvinella palmiformis]|uniref:Protein disulfide-isomerase n=1 Tax=Paralvinella palmiformis TaxID=53620 RepID=A0AAD9MZP2_9ANNE|nr:hypothetical protein LSH36_352g00009 [Paralvinella palmiformis]
MVGLLYLFGALALASAGDVLQYTDSNFDDSIADAELVLVKFYAPWCGHCKKLAPEFEKAATSLKNGDPPITLAEVDCTDAGKDVCSKHDVKGFPTLKAFKRDGIVKYMRSKAGPTSKELKSVEAAEKYLSVNEHAIVGFFESMSSDLYKQFMKLADSLSEDFRFAYSTEKAVMDKYGYKENIVIFQPKKLQNKFEDAQLKYDGEAVLHKMKTWVHDNINGLCGHRTTSNMDQFKKPLVVAYYDVDYMKNAKGTNYWRNRVMKVGKKLRDEGKTIYFAVSGTDDFSQELSEYGLTGGEKPVVAARDASDKKYVMSDQFSMENLEKFIRDFLDGQIKPYLKSEPVPEDNDGPVKVVVAETFDDIVNDESKDVLIEFYAPWCGHCKNLAPKFEELGQKLAKETDVVIAKMDATANDVPSEYEVRGFPTLYYAPKRSKSNPKKYDGGREVNDFIKYLAKESSDGLKGYDRDGKKKKSEL